MAKTKTAWDKLKTLDGPVIIVENEYQRIPGHVVPVTVQSNDGVEATFVDAEGRVYYWNKVESPYPLPRKSDVPSKRDFLARFPVGSVFLTKCHTGTRAGDRMAIWGEPKPLVR